jgi:hypothetical protein
MSPSSSPQAEEELAAAAEWYEAKRVGVPLLEALAVEMIRPRHRAWTDRNQPVDGLLVLIANCAANARLYADRADGDQLVNAFAYASKSKLCPN